MKFSDLNTNILGTSATSQISISSITNSSSYSIYGGVYPPSASATIPISNFFSTLSGTLGTFFTDGTNGGCLFGKSVAMSKDGTTMAVGVGVRPTSADYLYNNSAVHIYVKSGSTWTLQQVLNTTTSVNYSTSVQALGMFGLALSSDGNTLIAGAPSTGGFQFGSSGAVVVFTRSGTTWTQQGTPIYSSDIYFVSPGPAQGWSVAVSDDGDTLAFGGPGNTNGSTSKSEGGTWVYTRSGSTWTAQGGRLYGTGASATGPGSKQGYSISLSSDGNTLAIGGNGDNAYTGAVWIFTRSGTTWTQQGSKLTGTSQLGTSSWSGGSNENDGGFGCSVSLSSDGNTLAVGAYGDNTNIGAVWVYTRSGSTWSIQGSKMIPSGYTGTPRIGNSVSLRPDGNTLFVGGYRDNSDKGAIWVYTRSGSTWTQQTKITSSKTNVYFGQSISGQNTSTFVTSTKDGVTSDNRTVTGTGSIFTFSGSGASWTEELSKYTPTDPSIMPGNGSFGSSSDLSIDGNTLAVAVGGSQSTASTTAAAQGAVFIYGRVNNTWVKQAILADYSNAAGAIFQGTPLCVLGSGVALSGDGTTCAVGCSQDWPNTSTQTAVGSIFVFTRPNTTSTTWTFQQRMIPTGYVSTCQMTSGYNGLAISADGNTIVGGASNDTNVSGYAKGAAYVFTRSGSTWTQQAKLVGTGVTGSSSNQGYAVGLSSDGNTLAVGGYSDNSYTGAIWIFTRSGSTWTQQAKITATGFSGSSSQVLGQNLRLSIDGNTLIAAAPGDNSVGSVFVFTRSGSTWTQRQKLLPSGETQPSAVAFGQGLALSADTKTLMVGGPDASNQIGSAWIFTRSGDHTTWTQQGSKFDFSSHSYPYSLYRFGYNILMSKTGKTVYVNGRDYLPQYSGENAGVLVSIT